jgi:hypothetical protein
VSVGRELTEHDRRLLVALADGELSGRRRAKAEALVRELPEGKRILERQRGVRRALAEGPTPMADVTVAIVAPASVRRRSPWLVRLAAPAVALAGVIAVALLVFRADQPAVVTQAADLAKRPATLAAPASDGTLLRAQVDGVRFPDWSARFGWHENGARTDTLDGRSTRTVFYEHMGHRIAYTIIPGRPPATPAGARVVERDGLQIALLHDPSHGGHDIAVFQRDGRTCVISGHVERVSTLIRLAAWKGDGAVRT